MRKLLTTIVLAILILSGAIPVAAQNAGDGSGWVCIENGQLWKTEEGETVQAHAPGFVWLNGLWYMVGEDRSHSWNPDVNLYSSPDLVHWKFEKKIIQNGVTDERLGRSRMIERAKLLHCRKTGQFVVWCHWESRDYRASEAAILEVHGTKQTTYLYVGDRWMDPDLPNTKTIVFPISFEDTRCHFDYHQRFHINFVTGEWHE